MGILISVVSQSLPPKPTWSANEMPDLSGRVVIVTGGNTGIGYETAKALLSKNAKVYIACRNEEKAKSAIERLERETSHTAHFLKLDLASLDSTKEAADKFLKLEKKLHILFNNAGVMRPSIDELTADGYDLQVGTNVLGHYYFTSLVLPALLAVSADGAQKARVVNTSSLTSEAMFMNAQKLDYSAFHKEGDGNRKRRKIGTGTLYSISKWMNIVYTAEFSRRYKDKGIISTALNPGNISTELTRHAPGFVQTIIKPFCYSPSLGALTQLYAGTSEHADEFDNQYFVPWARRATPKPSSQDPEVGKQLWEWLETQVKKHA